MENIFYSRVKPDFTIIDEEKLKNMIIEFTKNNCEIKEKNELIEYSNITWKNIPLSDNIDCIFCLEKITNGDNLITKCCHYFHSSCYFKYFYSQISNKKNINNDIKNIFRCPTCRNLLIDIKEDKLSNNTIQTNDEDNLSIDIDIDIEIDINSGLWIYNEIESSENISNDDSISLNTISTDFFNLS